MPSQQTEMPDVPLLMPLITGAWASQAICVAAQLGLADLLHDRPRPVAELAAATETDAFSLVRLLRVLTALGVFVETEADVFGCAALGEQLRTGVPGSLRNFAMYVGSEDARRAWSDLSWSIRTGGSAFRNIFGASTFEHRANQPEAATIFNEAMAELTRGVGRAAVAAYDFGGFRTIVDIGGGNGALLSAILPCCPDLQGTIFDLPSGTAGAAEALTAAGVGDRCRIAHGDFFETVPRGADAYLLKSVIHDWGDADSCRILASCAAAMTANSRLLLIEQLLPVRIETTAGHRRAVLTDLNMLVMTSGCERTEVQYRGLLASSGLAVEAVIATSSPFSIVAARPFG